ncbi:MAG TPA: RICIN domain-containing protein, partial [Terriglobus sp.]
GMFAGVGHVIEPQLASQVSSTWPSGNVDVRLSGFMSQAQQKWAITSAKGAGGYLGSPYFRITIAGTERALTATANGELTVAPSFTSAPEQLWRIDQLADGTWRIMPKAMPNSAQPMVLSSIGSGGVSLSRFDPASDKQHWQLHLQ